MFQSTRLKLTAWYLVIIMFISIVFSMVIYAGINSELQRLERLQELRRVRFEQSLQVFPGPPLPVVNSEEIIEARNRLIVTLAMINLGIFLVAGGAGYFLAGRTLQPIKIMLDEQNRFITDASHELKTPLTALRSEIEVYFLGKNHSITAADHLLKSNLEEVVVLQELSENLMTLVQYNARNKKTIPLEAISLGDVLGASIKRVTPLAQKKHIAIQHTGESITVEGEKQNLQKLFIILLDNAIKYSAKGAEVLVEASSTDHVASIRIQDHGMGISEIDIPHIFDRFYRADQSRSKAAVSGYGLGLSIAKQIVLLHKGTIIVKSTQGKGTTFIVQLPMSKTGVNP